MDLRVGLTVLLNAALKAFVVSTLFSSDLSGFSTLKRQNNKAECEAEIKAWISAFLDSNRL
jgi:hypothetical protein